MRYGYARVSSKTQDYSAQVEALEAAGCERIFSEKRSGKSAKDRPKFSKVMRTLVPGDTVVVSKLDRLARSTRDLHNVLHDLQEKDCGFVSLAESWCDTTSKFGRLMMTIMGGINEFECQSAFKFDPSSASNFDPFERRGLVVALASSELAGIAETRRARVA
jgi:DNA invertase Pin-like site-specific DNA recombinase